jgi:hypothetical protein
VRAEEIERCDTVVLINAMMDLETGSGIDRVKIRAAEDQSGSQQPGRA